ncbi:hypothetical protein OG558_17945 [Kribbella sp. NBC_01510]|uniref:hypothetical protein n=1 Tax=Kribbella sp. NBC_01510 TaxID=2903581 RepID=UPI0038671A1D
MTRTAPGIAAVVAALLLGATACGNDTGATGGSLQNPAAKKSALAAPADKKPKSALAGLVVLPRGYLDDTQNSTGPFTATAFLANWSADPATDRALLLNAAFTEGYRASRLSPDKKKRFTLQLFKTGSAAKARVLQRGFWSQETHERSFDVPDALSDARVAYDGGLNQSVAIAEVSFVAGALVAELSVQQTGALGTDLRPDTGLLASLAKEQRARLTATSS